MKRLIDRLKNLSIRQKLFYLMGTLGALILIELLTLCFSINTLSSVRAYVGGEGLWSKAQKDAIYALRVYGRTKNEARYKDYQTLLKVNLGDSKARMELEKSKYNYDVAYQGFLEGRNHPEDIDGMIKAFRRFRDIYYIDRAITIWTEADAYIAKLIPIGQQLHSEIQQQHPSTERIEYLLSEVNDINTKVTVLENDFSYVLGEGSRWLEGLILKLLLLIGFTVGLSCIFLIVSISKGIAKGIEGIMEASDRIADGDLSTRAKIHANDELGILARSFNEMTQKLENNSTDRARIEESIKKYSTLLSDAQRIAQIGSWEWELNSTEYTWSEELYRIYGVDPATFHPTFESFFSLIPPEEHERVGAIFQEGLRTKSKISYYHKIIRKDNNSVRIMHQIGDLVLDAEGNILKATGTTQDVTEAKNAETALIQAKERAEASEKAKQLFLAKMSHEIRTPMNAIIGFANILEDSQLSPNQKECINAIRVSGDNLLVILNDILDFSKIEAGRMEVEKVPFSVKEIAGNLVSMLRIKAIARNNKLSYSIDRRIPMEMIGDPTRINQILMNLVSNGIKFTENGEVSVKIELRKEDEQSVTIGFEVKDSGIGIPEDKLDSIFESFSQVSNETARLYGGTGLGLAIVKQLVNMQGGSIHVESVVGEGSRFFFELQFEKSGMVPKEYIAVEQFQDLPVVNDVVSNNIRILLAEDNPINQLLAIKYITKWGFKLDIAENGRIALEKFKKNKYDLILMDIQMPEMDGYEATRTIRTQADSGRNDVPIIAMTAHALNGEKENCEAAGMTDYISKPFDPDNLQSMIRRYALAS